ncbi:MAG: hypothetical protein KA152_13850 [Verrucomicrobiales bacterium]|nr:hypothetical protein [Verrucomicrobiales bacterium]MBP9222298.1 hypothetical protein [Verrucomicrobiales bacterium]HQZ27924.1 hypothetical protein [Verrucomicrobiales bacterium]
MKTVTGNGSGLFAVAGLSAGRRATELAGAEEEEKEISENPLECIQF